MQARALATVIRSPTDGPRMLVSDFLASGGKIEVVEFHSPADLGALRQKTLINATGYGARALFGDESVVPVRGSRT